MKAFFCTQSLQRSQRQKQGLVCVGADNMFRRDIKTRLTCYKCSHARPSGCVVTSTMHNYGMLRLTECIFYPQYVPLEHENPFDQMFYAKQIAYPHYAPNEHKNHLNMIQMFAYGTHRGALWVEKTPITFLPFRQERVVHLTGKRHNAYLRHAMFN